MHTKDSNEAKLLFNEWISEAFEYDLEKFKSCAKTFFFQNQDISNSFNSNLSNGFIEDCNNKIKVLKRNAYGFRNFRRFRNQILHIFSHQRDLTLN